MNPSPKESDFFMSRVTRVAALAAGLTVALTGTASAAKLPTLTVRPVVAPNVFGSPSFSPFLNNAIDAFHTGDRTQGSGPSQYKEVKRITFSDLVCSGFPSWRGTADPANAYGLAYANELGNRLHLAWRLKAYHGKKVDIANGVHYEFNAPAATGLTFIVDRTTYSSSNVGITWVGKPGGGNDIVKTSGTGPVDEIIGLSPGNCEAAQVPAGATLADQQTALDAQTDGLKAVGGFDIGAKVQYSTVTKTATVQVR
jgi:hypothetical protein